MQQWLNTLPMGWDWIYGMGWGEENGKPLFRTGSTSQEIMEKLQFKGN